MNDLSATDFTKPKLRLSKEEFEEIAGKIKSHL
jgi:hypothetical protein